jgi:pentatricopeptide repeat protein
MESSAKGRYDLGLELFREGKFGEAREIFESLVGEDCHPNNGLWATRCAFAMGDFDAVVVPDWIVEDGRLADGWLQIGIFSAALRKDEMEVNRLLGLSEKVSGSKRVAVFLESTEFASETRENAQAVKVVRRYMRKGEYVRLLRL